MANYIGQERTNYFRVKDVDAFKRFAEERGCELISKTYSDGIARHSLLPGANREGRFFHGDDSIHAGARDCFVLRHDFLDLLAPHLADGEVCVMVGVGYFSGYAIAINGQGERTSVDLEEIYERACEEGLGSNITPAHY